MAKDDNSLAGLLKKSDGVLKRFGDVWSTPDAIMDVSGTNLRLPLFYVSDAEVQEALRDGKLSVSVTDAYGRVNAVRTADSTAKVITTALAGSAEMGTELEPGSRVEHDAGAKRVTPEEAERAAAASLATMSPVARQEVEGAERKGAAAPKPVVPTKGDGK